MGLIWKKTDWYGRNCIMFVLLHVISRWKDQFPGRHCRNSTSYLIGDIFLILQLQWPKNKQTIEKDILTTIESDSCHCQIFWHKNRWWLNTTKLQEYLGGAEVIHLIFLIIYKHLEIWAVFANLTSKYNIDVDSRITK